MKFPWRWDPITGNRVVLVVVISVHTWLHLVRLLNKQKFVSRGTGAPQPETPESAEGVSISEQVRRSCRDGAAAAVVSNVFSSLSFRVGRIPMTIWPWCFLEGWGVCFEFRRLLRTFGFLLKVCYLCVCYLTIEKNK